MQTFAVGLDYENVEELKPYGSKVNVPVYAGDTELQRRFMVDRYPTVYILNADGSVAHVMVGYTSRLDEIQAALRDIQRQNLQLKRYLFAFGIALALARDGHFEWEDFRQQLIAAIGDWEDGHALADPSWNYYDRWLQALEAVLVQAGVATPEEIAALPAAEA